MDNSNRPLSPHLQVYRLPLTGLLSITHRVTGILLAVGVLFFAAVLVAVAGGPGDFALVQPVLHSTAGRIVLFVWSVALFFHFCHGVRHLIWDSGFGFQRDDMNRWARAELFGSLALTLLVWGGVWISVGGG